MPSIHFGVEFFVQTKMTVSYKFTNLGGWPEKGSSLNEIAIVGILTEKILQWQ
ncbi:MAG: hypothetical protein LUC88_03995 [Prevotella sp.]|nr:hypothetical protein [Prevotella sp.]